MGGLGPTELKSLEESAYRMRRGKLKEKTSKLLRRF
jgi:hypothetical protein